MNEYSAIFRYERLEEIHAVFSDSEVNEPINPKPNGRSNQALDIEARRTEFDIFSVNETACNNACQISAVKIYILDLVLVIHQKFSV